MSNLTVLALQNADVLRAIRATPPAEIPTITALANLLGRDVSNFSKTLKLLSGSELIDVISSSPLEIKLTPSGDAALAALARAEDETGEVELPAGWVALTRDQVGPDPDNARKVSGLSDVSIAQMADSLKEKGFLQQPGVRTNDEGAPPWLLTWGERRWRAWGLLIEQGVWPATKRIVCKVYDGDELDRLEAGLVENLQSSNINNLEAGEGFLRLVERHGRTPKDIAKTMGWDVRTVQIAIKVADEAEDDVKAKYLESERAYSDAKAAGETGVKRTFTWENLRDEVRLPKHKAALDKNGRVTLLVVELAHRLLFDETTFHNLPGDWTEISPPPGGGWWAEAEGLGLVEDNRESDVVLARLSEKARHWLTERGFFKDPNGVLYAIRTEALGPMGERLAREEGRYATSFVNAPKPPPVIEVVEPQEDDDAAEDVECYGCSKPFSGEPDETFCPACRPLAVDEDDEELDDDERQGDEPRRRPPHPEEATDDTITPYQALVLGEILHKTCHKPTLMGEGLYSAALESPYPEMRTELKPLLWGGYLAATTTYRESGSVEILRVTETGERWLNQNQLNPLTNSNNLYTLQAGAKLRPPVSRVYALPWLNPPIAERAAVAESSRDQAATPPALEAAMRQLLDTRVDPAATAAPDQPQGPGFTDEEWVALVELAHKINVEPVETRGGAIIGALVGNYQSGPGAKVAQALIHKRMIGFAQAPSGMMFIAYLAPGASEHFDEPVDDDKLALTHSEGLPAGVRATLAASGEMYVTPWLNVTPQSAAGPILTTGSDLATDRIEIPIENWSGEEGASPALVDTTEALEASDSKIPASQVDTLIRQCSNYLLVFAREADAIETHVAIGTKTEADELADVLMASGLYETIDLYVGGRTANAVCKSWTRQ